MGHGFGVLSCSSAKSVRAGQRAHHERGRASGVACFTCTVSKRENVLLQLLPGRAASRPHTMSPRSIIISHSAGKRTTTMPQARAKRTALVAFTFAFCAHSGSGWAIRSSSIRSTKVPSLHSCMSNSRRVTSTCRNRLVPTCELERLPRQTLKRLVPICPTMEKWLAHYGQTATERQRRVVNGIGTSFVLYWLAFFASRTLIGPFAWRVSSILVFLQAFLWPVLESFRHTLELWGEGSRVERRRTKGALFTGRC